MKPILLFFSLACWLTAGAQVLIKNATVVDVEAKKLLPAQDVLIEGTTITAVGKKLSAPAGAQVIDGSGKWLMPGLVDAHVHFFQSGGLYTRPDAVDLRKTHSYEKEVEWVHNNMENFLRRYTRAGITTVIDVGATLNFLRQRDSFRTKTYSPTVYMTGPLLTTYEPDVFKNLKDDEPFYLMKTPNEARAYVQKQLPLKPDFIKIWYILLGRNKDSSARAGLPLVQAVIDEAHKAGLRVAVHATERITASLAVSAGADYLVHGVEDEPVDAAFINLLKSKGTVLCPTLVVAGNYNKVLGQTYAATAEDFRYANPVPLNAVFDMTVTAPAKAYKTYLAGAPAQALKHEDSLRMSNLKKLADAGVTIATGTDAGNIGTQHVSSYFDELKAMQQSGMDTWRLLQASTLNGAKAVNKQAEFGAVKKGLRADLLLLSKDPIESVANWQYVDWVINKGEAMKPDSLLPLSPVELADEQLAAYNAHDLEAFLRPYAGDVEGYSLSTGKLQFKGKEAMRRQYSFLAHIGDLHCNVVNRIVQGNTVIDHEDVLMNGGPLQGVAIYEIRNGKIAKVWFVL